MTEVAIVGGGPVGLCLACLLVGRGISCVVLERRQEPLPYSRAIGIHPPALDVLDSISVKLPGVVPGVGSELREAGLRIEGALVFYAQKQLGRVSLTGRGWDPCPISVPQSVTESVLERRLLALSPGSLRRDIDVTEVREEGDTVRLTYPDGSLTARFVVGCDGKQSLIRQAAGIRFPGGAYPDRYLMGDFEDESILGLDVAFFLSREGIVESFPLPGGMRRWVARMSSTDLRARAEPVEAMQAACEPLIDAISRRAGIRLRAVTCRWLSPFGIEHYLADRFATGRFALAGDAAHIVSPIGGQGMNLGFLDAADLARSLHAILRSGAHTASTLGAYSRYRRRIARRVISRAFFNTVLGRPNASIDPRPALIWAILNVPPIHRYFARLFTMRDLEPPPCYGRNQ